MNLVLFHSRVENPEVKTVKQTLPSVYEATHNTSEGSKFPHDDIRIEDQPLMYTEGCIAAGCPEDLW